MNVVNTYPLAVGTTTTGTTQVFVGQSDVLQLYVPRISTTFGSAVVAFRLMGSPTSAISAITSYFYDYSGKTPNECVITVSTGGLYEIPNAGGPGFIRIQYDVAATAATTVYLQTCRVTY